MEHVSAGTILAVREPFIVSRESMFFTYPGESQVYLKKRCIFHLLESNGATILFAEGHSYLNNKRLIFVPLVTRNYRSLNFPLKNVEDEEIFKRRMGSYEVVFTPGGVYASNGSAVPLRCKISFHQSGSTDFCLSFLSLLLQSRFGQDELKTKPYPHPSDWSDQWCSSDEPEGSVHSTWSNPEMQAFARHSYAATPTSTPPSPIPVSNPTPAPNHTPAQNPTPEHPRDPNPSSQSQHLPRSPSVPSLCRSLSRTFKKGFRSVSSALLGTTSTARQPNDTQFVATTTALRPDVDQSAAGPPPSRARIALQDKMTGQVLLYDQAVDRTGRPVFTSESELVDRPSRPYGPEALHATLLRMKKVSKSKFRSSSFASDAFLTLSFRHSSPS